MSTLLLRLAAPYQAWGTESNFERRTTQREPSKSGVIGLLAAALGRGREDCIKDLAALNFGVRIDQPGTLVRDYHTARVFNSTGKHERTYVINRYYISDAVFLVGLEGDTAFLENLKNAVDSPFYPIYLGRRSCPPTGRIVVGMRNKPLEDALTDEEWFASEWYKKREKTSRLTLILDSAEPNANRRRDLPVSFSHVHRQHTYRYINDMHGKIPVQYATNVATEHDPFDSDLASMEDV